MLINGLAGDDDLGFAVPGLKAAKGAFSKVGPTTLLFPAAGLTKAAVSAVAKRVIPQAGPEGPRQCGLWDRIAIHFGSKDRGCQLPNGELSGDASQGNNTRTAMHRYIGISGGKRQRNRPSAQQLGELGIAPLVIAAAPIAQKYGPGIIKGAFNLLGSHAPPTPPCTFGDKVNRFFGGKPRCK